MARLSSAGLPLLCGLMAALLVHDGSWAQEDHEAELYLGWQLTKVRVMGVPSEHASRVRDGLVLATTSGLVRRRYGLFYPSVLEEDLRRIRLYLGRNGYPEARARVIFEPEAVTQRVEVTITVSPGPAVRVEEVTFGGLPEALSRRARRSVTLESNDVFSEQKLVESQANLAMALQNGGYAKAEVETRIEETTGHKVRVEFLVDAGPLYVFGDIHVEGVAQDLVPVAKRAIDLRPGQRYSARLLDRAHESLRALNLFRRIQLTTEEGDPGKLDVLATLSERDPRTVEIRGGYWSEDGLRGRFAWQHRNLLGGGRGIVYYITVTSFHVQSELRMSWPALIAPRTREAVALGFQNEIEANYTQLGVGAEVSSTYRPTLHTMIRGSAAVTYVEVDEDSPASTIEDEGIIVPLTGVWRWDTSDNPLNPSRGKALWDELRFAIPGISDNEYIRNEAGVNLYLPVLGRGVFATRAVVGLATPLGSSAKIIPGNRFYAGGTNSNRGFDRRKLGPLDAAGNPVGGRVSIVTMTEFRFFLLRLPKNLELEGAVFLDVGQVWRTAEHVKFSDLEPSIGPALMVNTPVGPIRLDLGFRLKDSGKQPDTVLNFAIGHPF